MPNRPLTFCAYSRKDIAEGAAESDLAWLHSNFSSKGMSDRIQEKHLDKLVVAKDAHGTIVWFYGLKFPHKAHLAIIETFGVNPNLRKIGFGRKVLFAAVRACVSVGKTQIRVTPHGNNDELKILKNAIEHTKVPIYINRPKGPYKELFTIKSTFVSDVQRALQHESHLFGRSAVTRASVVKKSARRLRRGRKH